jgi:hypothetical protein
MLTPHGHLMNDRFIGICGEKLRKYSDIRVEPQNDNIFTPYHVGNNP